MEILIFVLNLIFFVGLTVFCLKQKHFLVMLLMLEFVVLSLYMFNYLHFLFMNYSIFINMIFLTFCVCEGVLGLSIMISLIRTHGNDYFQSFNILW